MLNAQTSTLPPRAIALLLAWAICTMTPGAATAVAYEKDVLPVATSLGITPESLVAHGIVEHNVKLTHKILEAIEDASGLRTQLAAHLSNVSSLSQDLANITASLKIQPDNSGLLVKHSELQQDLTQVMNDIETLRDALLDQALAGVAPEAADDLIRWRETALRRVPPAFRVLELTDEQWSDIAMALRAQARTERQGVPFTGEMADLLHDIETNVDVIAAEQRLEVQLDPVKAIFAQFHE